MTIQIEIETYNKGNQKREEVVLDEESGEGQRGKRDNPNTVGV